MTVPCSPIAVANHYIHNVCTVARSRKIFSDMCCDRTGRQRRNHGRFCNPFAGGVTAVAAASTVDAQMQKFRQYYAGILFAVAEFLAHFIEGGVRRQNSPACRVFAQFVGQVREGVVLLHALPGTRTHQVQVEV
jgi:hypothetical protein